jgi:hypothetical protein
VEAWVLEAVDASDVVEVKLIRAAADGASGSQAHRGFCFVELRTEVKDTFFLETLKPKESQHAENIIHKRSIRFDLPVSYAYERTHRLRISQQAAALCVLALDGGDLLGSAVCVRAARPKHSARSGQPQGKMEGERAFGTLDMAGVALGVDARHKQLVQEQVRCATGSS